MDTAVGCDGKDLQWNDGGGRDQCGLGWVAWEQMVAGGLQEEAVVGRGWQ